MKVEAPVIVGASSSGGSGNAGEIAYFSTPTNITGIPNSSVIAGGQIAFGTAAIASRGLQVNLSLTASAGSAVGGRFAPTLVAAGNSDTLIGLQSAPAFTPGAFTSVSAVGFRVNAFSVATFTSPGDPYGIFVGAVTGTGAINAVGVLVTAPTGATNNYLIADGNLNTFTVQSSGATAVGVGPSGNRMFRVGGSITAAGALALGSGLAGTLVAAANNDVLEIVRVTPTFTPGTFTGLSAKNLNLQAFSVAAFITPADPVSLDIGIVTGTGATNAFGIRIAPPAGATNNYLISHTTPGTFNVSDVGFATTTGVVANVVADLGALFARASGAGDQLYVTPRAAGNGTQINSRNSADNAYAPLLIGSANIQLVSQVTKYNNVTTAGLGVAAIYGQGRVVAKTNVTSGTIATYTPTADGSFLIAANVLVTATTAASFTVTCTYTDEGNTARTLTLTFSQVTGVFLTTITNVTGVGAYEGVPLYIRVKANTAITIQTAGGGTYTGVTYNADALITQAA